MQKFIRSNPFFIPLFGLFIGYVWNRWGLFNPIFLICGFRCFAVSVLVLKSESHTADDFIVLLAFGVGFVVVSWGKILEKISLGGGRSSGMGFG